jgi:phosphatidylglycerophosphate synthase
MLDGYLRKIIDPPLNNIGKQLANLGISANAITLFGLTIGLASAIAIAANWFLFALVLLIISRIADGLDGAVARATKKTDFGGYLDISADFLFYGAIILGFIISNPSQNAIMGAFLLLSFNFNGATFLGYAILAQKHELKTSEQGEKSIYFSDGLIGGAETIIFLIALCIWPKLFPLLATIFALLTFTTAIMRIFYAKKVFLD